MKLIYNVHGTERKGLAQALGKITLWDVVYLKAPSYAYKVGNYTIDRNGAIDCPASATREIIDRIAEKLGEDGFILDSIEGDPLTISLPQKLFTEDALDRLREIIGSKAPLFRRAFKAENITFDITEGKLNFSWFRTTGADGEFEAYSHFICALGKMARTRQRITAKPYTGDNDKFTMRLFLVQLGLKGPKYKQARKLLLQNLSGNSAWRYRT